MNRIPIKILCFTILMATTASCSMEKSSPPSYRQDKARAIALMMKKINETNLIYDKQFIAPGNDACCMFIFDVPPIFPDVIHDRIARSEMLVFLRAQHQRLGADSPVHLLNPYIFRDIIELLRNSGR